ncbi:MAG: hypothetical protein ACQESR_04940 [Planctomycetota bacterium]
MSSTPANSPHLAADNYASSKWSLRYFHVYICCLLTLACPADKLHYLLPVIYLAAIFFTNRDYVFIRVVTVSGIVLCITALSLLIDCFRGHEVNLPGAVIAVIGYSFLFIALAERPDIRMSDRDYQNIVALTAWFVIIQSLIGFVQFGLSGGESDAVAGTFGILDFRQGQYTFGQVFCSLCLSGMVLFLLLEYRRPLAAVAITAGLLAFILAQATHQIGLYIIAIGTVVMLQYRSLKSFAFTVTLAAVILLLVLYIYPGTIDDGIGWYRKTFQMSKSPKLIILEDTGKVVRDIKNVLLGTGIGQFTSRGALITTGSYISVDLPDLFVATSDYYDNHVQSAMRIYEEVGEGSAISKPYFSLLTIPVEYGVIQASLIALFLAMHFRLNLRLSRSPHPQVAATGVFANIGVLYLVLLCMVENYAEFCHALLVPFALYLVAVSRAIQTQTSGKEGTSDRPRTMDETRTVDAP